MIFRRDAIIWFSSPPPNFLSVAESVETTYSWCHRCWCWRKIVHRNKSTKKSMYSWHPEHPKIRGVTNRLRIQYAQMSKSFFAFFVAFSSLSVGYQVSTRVRQSIFDVENIRRLARAYTHKSSTSYNFTPQNCHKKKPKRSILVTGEHPSLLIPMLYIGPYICSSPSSLSITDRSFYSRASAIYFSTKAINYYKLADAIKHPVWQRLVILCTILYMCTAALLHIQGGSQKVSHYQMIKKSY